MAPQLQRGGCDRVCGRRTGCRRRCAGAAQRPSPVGSTHRPFTARVADALAQRLAGELPTAQATAPADELPRNKLQAALAALPENDRGVTLLLASREGLTSREMAPPEYQFRRPARGLSRFAAVAQRFAGVVQRCHRGVGLAYRGIEVRDRADTAHHVRPVRERTQTRAPGPEGDDMVCRTHIKRLSPQRAPVLAAAALLSGVLVAGCAASSHSPTAATVGDVTSSVSTVAAAATTSARSITSSRAATA